MFASVLAMGLGSTIKGCGCGVGKM